MDEFTLEQLMREVVKRMLIDNLEIAIERGHFEEGRPIQVSLKLFGEQISHDSLCF